jgi:Protein of unknown function (DUF1566)
MERSMPLFVSARLLLTLIVGSLVLAGCGGGTGVGFSRLNSDGSDYTGSGDYASEPWACVRDNTTGLVWEVKTNDGAIHDKSNTYRWGGKTALGNDPGPRFNDWDELVDGTNSEGLCNYSDWVVPTKIQLSSIVAEDRPDPTIDTDYFPNTPSSSNFWSSSPYPYDFGNAWDVDFNNGSVNGGHRANFVRVRLVRGGQ